MALPVVPFAAPNAQPIGPFRALKAYICVVAPSPRFEARAGVVDLTRGREGIAAAARNYALLHDASAVGQDEALIRARQLGIGCRSNGVYS